MSKKYNASSIKVLEGLAAVRKRPAMYIGSTNSYGLHHLVWEILDNSIDEIINGYGTAVQVKLVKPNEIEIQDNGRGIPVDKHPVYKKPAINIIFEKLHSGAKFDDASYKTSGGLHGVGSSVVNALSEKLEITVYKDGFEYQLSYKNGGKIDKPLKKTKTKNRNGTTVRFVPDAKIFRNNQFDSKTIKETLKTKAYLNSKIVFKFINEVNEENVDFVFENGLISFLEDMNKNKNPLFEPIKFSGVLEDISIDIVLNYIQNDESLVHSFANNVNTVNGGSHLTGFKSALTKSINNYAIDNGFIKKTNRFQNIEIQAGLRAIVSVFVPEKFIQFEGQTKTKLGTPKARNIVEKLFLNFFDNYLIENKNTSGLIVKKVLDYQKLRLSLRKTKELHKNKAKNVKNPEILSGKLVHCRSKKPELCEIFLVEGDSAGGTAKGARDWRNQAILPLRGKLINSLKASEFDIVKNNELNMIINALECGINDELDVLSLRYNKIIIMTDADTDGAHIQTLILTFFWTHMKRLIFNGNIYIAQAPLFSCTRKGKILYFWTEKEFNDFKTNNSITNIQRFKGLGEMNVNQLKITTMNPDTRKLIRITIDNLPKAIKYIDIIMGTDAEKRKKWIEENIDFSLK